MKKIVITIIVALILGGGGTFLWLYYGGFGGESGTAVVFIDVYGEYAEIAEQVELLVNAPGVENNTDRAQLLTLLESILTKTMTPEKRDNLARLAYTNLDTLEKEIDAAQSAQATLYEKLQALDNASRNFSSIVLQKKAALVVSSARERAQLSAQITSILSEMNEQTHAIVTRILADKGKLSEEHIISINNATAEAQARFDTLEELYVDLRNKRKATEVAFKAFAKVAI